MIRIDQVCAPSFGIAIWGDSQVAGAGSDELAEDICSVVQQTTGLPVANNGIGGNSPTQIVDRYIAMPPRLHGWVHILFMGRIETGDDGEDFIRDANRAAAHPAFGRTLIMAPTNGEYADDYAAVSPDPAGAKYAERIEARDYVLATFPNNAIDLMPTFLDANDGSAGDLTDVDREIVPRSLRVDNIHNVPAAQALVAGVWVDELRDRFWI